MADAAPQLDLSRYLDVLRRRKRTVFGSTLVLVVAALAISLLQAPVYQGQALVLLRASGAGSPFGESGDDIDPELAVATELQVLKSTPVQAAVSERFGQAPPVSVRRVDTSLMIEVQVRSNDRTRAADLATGYARAYIDYRQEQATQDLLTVGTQVEQTLSDLDRELSAVEREISSATGTEAQGLIERRDGLISQRAVFRQRLDELQFQAAANTAGARLVAAAPIPESPVSPKPVRAGILAAVGGLILGMIVVALRENLDDSIKSRADVAQVAAGLPVLGTIPLVPAWRSAQGPRLVGTSSSPTPAASESFRTLRTSVQLLGVEQRLRTIQVTSPSEGEGKTTVLTNLALVMAQAGERVVVVDCDLRKPRAHLALGASKSPGVTSIMSGETSIDGAVQFVSIGGYEVAILGAGPIPPNPSELLASKRTSQLLFDLRTRFDIVLVDSPPVLAATDATILTAWVDATMLVVNAGSTTRSALRLTLGTVEQGEAPIVGVVLNRAEEQTHGYRYGYGDDPADDAPAHERLRSLGRLTRPASRNSELDTEVELREQA